MSTDADPRPPLLRFLDAFLQEGNIKWILGLGMLILFGSSLMLVTTHWDSYPPVWKYLILLAYTAGVQLAGQLAYHRLGLRKTGTGLMALTVLLIPLTFLSVRWIVPQGLATLAGLFQHAGLMVLLGVNVVFTWFASRRIFLHFLRRPQPTFQASYVTLCAAGAVLPFVPAVAAPFAALLLWAVFTVGTVKVNRHVFWLTEEHRQPRIYGFFPILLLGGQFVTLFWLMLASSMPWAWIGFGTVLVSIPLLLAADAWVRVHEQRYGQCARPLPWNIAVPMFLGVFAATAGVGLAAVGYPGTATLVPASALAAVVMTLTARRTRHAAFVWAALLFVLTVYQTSPVFFREMARTVTQTGTAAVHEPRLPYAFYGLTYLPLLMFTTLIAVWRARRGDRLFAPVLRQFSIGLGVVLLAAAFTHAKALLPVGCVLGAWFLMQMCLFRDRRLLVPAIAACLTATAGVETFVTRILQWHGTPELPLLAWAVSGGLLLFPGALLDRWTRRFPPANQAWEHGPFCQLASLGVVVGAAVIWLAQPFAWHHPPLMAGAVIAGLLLVHAVRWRRGDSSGVAASPANLIGELALTFAGLYPVFVAARADIDVATLAGIVAAVLAGYGVMSLVLARRPRSLLRDAFETPAAHVSRWGSLVLITACVVPSALLTTFTGDQRMPWVAVGLTLGVLCHSAWRRQSAWQTVVCWIASLLCLGAAVVELSRAPDVIEWLPAAWAGFALVAVPVVQKLRSSSIGDRDIELTGGEAARANNVVTALEWCIVGTTVAIGTFTLPVFSLPMRVAGGTALAALWWLTVGRSEGTPRTALWMLLNWHVLSGLLKVMCPTARFAADIGLDTISQSGLALAAAASALLHFWTRRERTDSMHRVVNLHVTALHLITGIGVLSSFAHFSLGLSLVQVVLAAAVFGLQAGLQIRLAVRKWTAGETPHASAGQRGDFHDVAEGHVWLAQAIVAAGIAYFVLFDVISFGRGWSLYLTLLGGIAAWAIGSWAARSPRLGALHRPLLKTGMCLPMATVLLGVYRHFAHAPSLWLGANSLALLLAAGFYFWRGLETRRSGLQVGSAAILNVALALLWRELAWSDPQLFMVPIGISMIGLVELLKRELPPRTHDPLRYAGALMILVSPTFHIVGGSWLHLVTLMIASVLVTLVAMGLRVRALMYTGSAFLVADVIAMVVRGSIDNPNLLWITGIGVGAAVIGLAAYCERHREQVLQRLRAVTAALESWE